MASRRESAMRYFDEQRDLFEERVAAGIEAYRKGNGLVTVVDESGKTKTGARVEIEQIGHHFRFGANLFMLDEFESEEKNRIYREKFPEVFNLATLPFYWNTLEPEEGQPRYAADSPRIYRRPAPDLCLSYCEEKGIEPKCHCLNYESMTPDWVRWEPDYRVFQAKLEKRMREISERYATRIPSFEVTNEHFWGKYQGRGYSCAYDQPDFVEMSYRMAEKYFPDNRLIINDYAVCIPETYNSRTAYQLLVENLRLRGCRIDSVGLQYHSFFPREQEAERAEARYNPTRVWRLLDSYEELGLPLQITEMTIPAYSNDPEDEEVQASLLTDIYRMFFAQKSMEAIIYWNVPDGYAAFAPQGDMTVGENVYAGGVLRYDLSEKPAWRALRHLIREEWHTHVEGMASDGTMGFRGFFGEYRVRVTTDEGVTEHTISLLPGRNNHFTLQV